MKLFHSLSQLFLITLSYGVLRSINGVHSCCISVPFHKLMEKQKKFLLLLVVMPVIEYSKLLVLFFIVIWICFSILIIYFIITGMIGWRSARPECQLEVFGRFQAFKKPPINEPGRPPTPPYKYIILGWKCPTIYIGKYWFYQVVKNSWVIHGS